MQYPVLGITFLILILIGDIEGSLERLEIDVLVENLAAVAERSKVDQANERIFGIAGHENIHVL